MKKFLAALLSVLLAVPALAEPAVSGTTVLERSVTLCRATNCYMTRTDEGYQLFDVQGNALSAAYRSMMARQNGLYLEVQNVSNSETLNCLGLLDAAGREILPLSYGDFEYYGNDWVLAYVLEPSADDSGEYKDSKGNQYVISRTDVVYRGQKIGSMGRDQYIKSYSVGDRGAYLYVKTASDHAYWIDGSFNIKDVTADGYVSTSEFDGFAREGVLHSATQQYAFREGCTLTADQVSQPVWFDSKEQSIYDLQGNVIASGLAYEYAYFRQNGFVVKDDSRLSGIIGLDGKVIVPCQYQEIAYSDEGLFASGYNAAVTPEGGLHFIDQTGRVTASVDYALSSGDYKGFIYNSPIVAVKNMGKFMVITATHGELSEKYDDISTPRAKHTIIAVKKGDNWGCIDMAGNAVIPFEHRYAPEISDDGTLVFGQTNDRQYVLYHLAEGAAQEAPANWTETKQSGEGMDEEPVLAEGAWACTCGTITNGKFCPECGSARPAQEKPADDGSWTCGCGSVNTGKFCPECGSPRPAQEVEPQCSSCGYKPEGSAPKFCPECGTKF